MKKTSGFSTGLLAKQLTVTICCFNLKAHASYQDPLNNRISKKRSVVQATISSEDDRHFSELLMQELIPVNVEDMFEDYVRDSYPLKTKVGWQDIDTVSVLKSMSPGSWETFRNEWLEQEVSAGNLIKIKNGDLYFFAKDFAELKCVI